MGNILYLACLIDYNLLTAFGSLASKQASGQQFIIAETDQLQSYIHTPFPLLQNYVSGTQIFIYDPTQTALTFQILSTCRWIWIDGSNYDKWLVKCGVFARSIIMDCIVSSATECEYGFPFMSARHLVWLKLIAFQLGYPQDFTEIFCDNIWAIGLAHDSTRIDKSKATDKRFHWIGDRVKRGQFITTLSKLKTTSLTCSSSPYLQLTSNASLKE